MTGYAGKGLGEVKGDVWQTAISKNKYINQEKKQINIRNEKSLLDLTF